MDNFFSIESESSVFPDCKRETSGVSGSAQGAYFLVVKAGNVEWQEKIAVVR
jgi:hypothetical protein